MERTMVIVGAGLAGASAAHGLREAGFDGRLVMIGEEPQPPYERPPLSKELLRGEREADQILVRPGVWYDEQGIDLRTGTRVLELTTGPVVALADGDRIEADAVLLATGGRPRRLPDVEGDRILYLRTLADAERLREHVGAGKRLLVVGAGFIGSEVAASARMKGTEVVVIEMAEVPLQRVLGEQVGSVLGEIHRDEGVDLRLGTGVETIQDRGTSVVIRTSSGDLAEGDACVVGIGISPNTELAEAAGAEIDNGVVVDEWGRTSLPGIFAAGDVANHFHPVFGRHIRVEHFDNAIKHGIAVGRSMLGAGEPFDDPHWFWSDQYDHNLQYAGFAWAWDEIVIRGSIEERSFLAFYVHEGVVRGAFGLNRGRDVRRAMRLVAARTPADAAVLSDEDVDLRTLAER